MAQTDNPLGKDMTDLGLVSPTIGDVLGNPNALQELQDQLTGLQAALQEPPPQANTMLDAAIQGAIAGSRGTVVDPLTGEESPGLGPTGFGAGLLTGLSSAVEGKEKQTLAEYMQRQKVARESMDQREKLSSGIRMVLAQNPAAFEALGATDEGQRVLGMLAYGIDVPVDPTAKLRGAEETLANKQLMTYYLQIMRSATDPKLRAKAAQEIQSMLDPDNKLDISPEDWVRGAVPSFSEIAKSYGDSGVQALNKYSRDGDLDSFMASLSRLQIQEPAKMTATQRAKLELAQKIAQIKKDHREVNGEELTDLDAIKQLPDEDRIMAENAFRNIAGDKDVPISRYVSELERAWDDIPQEIRDSDPTQASIDAQNLAWSRTRAAMKLRKKTAEADRRNKPAVVPPAADADASSWKKLVEKRAGPGATREQLMTANKELVADYIRIGKADRIPAVNRKAAGF